jgi:bacillithiol biosynthesis cysteine-adding enzyme BshC
MYNSIEINKIKGSTKLYSDYLHDFDKLKKYYHADYKQIITKESLPFENAENNSYAQIYKVLEEQNSEWLALPNMKRKLTLLNKKGSQVIITGQQLGLMTGPLYTIYKALGAVKLAEMLTAVINKPVVPLFWLEGEDHDLKEANKIRLLDLENKVRRLELKGFSSPNRYPVGELTIGTGIENLIQELERLYPDSEFKSAVLQLMRESYTSPSLWKKAFARLLIKLLGKYAPLIIDASDKRLKKIISPIFKKAIEHSKNISEIMLKNNEQLKKDGYHLQVKFNPLSTNLFLRSDGEKYLLEMSANGIYHLKGKAKSYSKDQLLTLIEQEPERFIPNVILRPVVQDYLFPTLSYVAGPAEIAYFAQIKPLYDFFGVKMPSIFPRPALTLMEKKIEKIIKKYDIDVQALFAKPEKVIENIENKEIAALIEEPFAKSDEKLQDIIHELRKVLLSIDVTLKNPLEKAAMKMKHQLHSLKEKSMKAGKKAQQTRINQIEKVRNNLFPEGNLQERCLNIIPFLIRYGFDLIDKIYDNIEFNTFRHKIIFL